ncbi:MAG: IS200/IS605 family transposase [Mycobacterium sp.]
MPSAPLDVQRGRSALYTLHAHVVFVTKVPAPRLHRRDAQQLRTPQGRYLRQPGRRATRVQRRDRSRPLARAPPTQTRGIAMLVNRLKGVSPRRLPQQYPTRVRKYLWGNHFWSPSYFATSCGGAPLTIKQYIEQQNRPD